MTFTLPALPYAKNALEPHMSAETFDYHHEKHHQAYINVANDLLPNSGLEGLSLDDAIMKAEGKLFNQLGQHYNHSLFWQSMTPNGGGKDLPSALADKIDSDLGGYGAFRADFLAKGAGQFGSGWVWLVLDNASRKLEVLGTANADCPLTDSKTPLLVCDVWEHAYYIDYRNARPKFLETFFDSLANWENATARLIDAA